MTNHWANNVCYHLTSGFCYGKLEVRFHGTPDNPREFILWGFVFASNTEDKMKDYHKGWVEAMVSTLDDAPDTRSGGMSAIHTPVSYTHLTLPTTPYV